jgi:hypothetical protein
MVFWNVLVDLVFLCVIRFLYLFFLRLLTFLYVRFVHALMHQRAMARAFPATPMLIQATAT